MNTRHLARRLPGSACLALLLSLLAAACSDGNMSDPATGHGGEATRPVPVMTASGPEPLFDEAFPRPARTPDVIYVPTPQGVVDAMLDLAAVGPGDVLHDLGSGDGRIPVTAARRFGIRAVGIDIHPARIREANANAEEAGVTDLVTFIEGDLFEADISEASVVMLYLLQSLNVKLIPKLQTELRPGTRIVSHAFDMGDQWEPEETRRVEGSVIHLWTVPGG